MNPLIDPLASSSASTHCSACGASRDTYKGKFLTVPVEPEARQEWLVRIGVIKPNDPVPASKRFYVCDNHFDLKLDFCYYIGRTRLRPGILPWRNLRTGTFSYHGYEIEKPAPCECKCCKHNNAATTLDHRLVTTQTDDVETEPLEEQDSALPPWGKPQCRMCLQETPDFNLIRMFCSESRQPVYASLMEKIYVTVGLLLNANQEEDSCICCDCLQQVEQAYQFRLQTRTNNRLFMASNTTKKQTGKRKYKRKLVEIEHIFLNSNEHKEKDVKYDPQTLQSDIIGGRVKLEPKREIE
ncbi:uncharacterized protein LOC134202317 [Armigeres subalbatus]|uniref:uncharacterized protein LOC134202317 n=1 Tax=Armigeres subalbatus TaxID=124917 RepID=UPI002ED4D53F